jgi:hypothetical protein
MERSGGPAAVIRQSTIDLARILDKGKNGSSKDSRHVLGMSTPYLLEGANDKLVRQEVERVCYYSKQPHTHGRAVGSSYTFQEVCIPSLVI